LCLAFGGIAAGFVADTENIPCRLIGGRGCHNSMLVAVSALSHFS